MAHALPTPTVLRRYFDQVAGWTVPAFELRWQDGTTPPQDRLWDLPENVSLVGPPPRRFGVKFERIGTDAYAVVVLWDRTQLAWDGLTRVQLLTSALAPLLKVLGSDLRAALEQPRRASSRRLHKVA